MRDQVIKEFFLFCKQVFYYKFIKWRQFKFEKLGKPLSIDFESEYNRIINVTSFYEDKLFHGLNEEVDITLKTFFEK